MSAEMGDLAFVALGSNLGDRDAHLAFARRGMGSLPQTTLVAESAIEETEPLGGMAQPKYLNQMVALDTRLGARHLLAALHALEAARGRDRQERWSPRTLDLDLVRYGDERSSDPSLLLPHPGFASRDFWRREAASLERQLRWR